MKKGIYFLAILNGFLFFTSSCKKDDDNNPSNMTNGKTTAVFNSKLVYGTMTDQDGNTYKTIKIGTQTWMAENLRTTKYRNGDSIPEVINILKWGGLSTGAYCSFYNTKNYDTIATYGRYYNWFAVSDSRNIAPIGWHIASDSEWTTLITYLGDSIAGSKLKEIGITHWVSPNIADNSSGFTALPGGGAGIAGIGYFGSWWSSTEINSNNAYTWGMVHNSSVVFKDTTEKNGGNSVRCIKD